MKISLQLKIKVITKLFMKKISKSVPFSPKTLDNTSQTRCCWEDSCVQPIRCSDQSILLILALSHRSDWPALWLSLCFDWPAGCRSGTWGIVGNCLSPSGWKSGPGRAGRRRSWYQDACSDWLPLWWLSPCWPGDRQQLCHMTRHWFKISVSIKCLIKWSRGVKPLKDEGSTVLN